MKKIFTFIKLSFLAALTLFIFSCSAGEIEIDETKTDCGSIKLSFAIPKFMVPDTNTSARMVMPSTRVIKLFIYDDLNNVDEDEHIYYQKEFSLSNPSIEYNDYVVVTANVDDVPQGDYEAGIMKIELYDTQENLLTHAFNDSDVTVTEETGDDAASVTFYALPASFSDISSDDFENGVYVIDDFELDANNFDIAYEAYKVEVPDGYGVNVKLNAINSSGKDVAVVIYTEDGVASDAGVTVKNNSQFNNQLFASIPKSYAETYYVVLYSKGSLTDVTLKFVLTDD